MADTAKLFKSGRSQAVRLPKEFRFEGSEVRITRHGNGVLLEPMEVDLDAMVVVTEVKSQFPLAVGGAEYVGDISLNAVVPDVLLQGG